MCSSRHRSNVNARTITGKRDAGATSVGQESAKYLGLLMYAVDRFESKVGTWEIPIDKETRFWLPPDPGCGGYSLMHMDAELKSFQERFIFRAPPAGTGPITFRVLVKQGETNKGAFCNTHASSRSYILLRLHAAPPAPCAIHLTHSSHIRAHAWADWPSTVDTGLSAASLTPSWGVAGGDLVLSESVCASG